MLNFNGRDLPEFIKVQTVNIQTLPVVNMNLKQIVGSSGRLAGRSDLGEKTITCEIMVVIPNGYSLQKCARELAVWLRGDDFNLSPLIIKDDPDVRYMAKIGASVDLTDLFVAGQGTIEFIIPSGDAEAVTTSSASGTNSVTVNNTGTKRVFPVIKATIGTAAHGGTVNIRNNTTGDRLTLNGNFKAGDVFTIDCLKNLVKKGDNVDISMLNLESKFFDLREGKNVIQCDNNNTTLEVTYRVKYL